MSAMPQGLASSYRVPMCFAVEDLSDQRLAEWLGGADSSARAGRLGASRRGGSVVTKPDVVGWQPSLRRMLPKRETPCCSARCTRSPTLCVSALPSPAVVGGLDPSAELDVLFVHHRVVSVRAEATHRTLQAVTVKVAHDGTGSEL